MVPTKIPKNTPTNTTFILVLPICGPEGLEGWRIHEHSGSWGEPVEQ